MKMQDVIGKLREEAPLLDKCAKDVDLHFERATGLARDLEYATSDDGRKLLRNELAKAMTEFGSAYRQLRCSIETVCLINQEYKEKLGPRTKKPKDAEGQQMLPGFEDAGGTPTTTGDASTTGGRTTPSFLQSGTPTTMGDTSTAGGRTTPSFLQSGRHG